MLSNQPAPVPPTTTSSIADTLERVSSDLDDKSLLADLRFDFGSAQNVLAHCGPASDVHSRIQRELESTDIEVRLKLAADLADLADTTYCEEALTALAKLANDGKSVVRQAAVISLWNFEQPAVPVLVGASSDSDREVRLAAVVGMGRIWGEKSRRRLEEKAADSNESEIVREAAEDGLSRHLSEVRPEITNWLSSSNEEEQLRALRILRLGPPAEQRNFLPEVLALLSSSTGQVRKDSWGILSRLDVDKTEISSILLQDLANSGTDYQSAVPAMTRILEFGPEAISFILSGLENSNPNIQRASGWLLVASVHKASGSLASLVEGLAQRRALDENRAREFISDTNSPSLKDIPGALLAAASRTGEPELRAELLRDLSDCILKDSERSVELVREAAGGLIERSVSVVNGRSSASGVFRKVVNTVDILIRVPGKRLPEEMRVEFEAALNRFTLLQEAANQASPGAP